MDSDCNARSLSKGNTKEGDKDDDNDNGEVEDVKKCSKQKIAEFHEYELNRQNNVENLKKQLQGLKEQYPIMDVETDSPKQAKSLKRKNDSGEPVLRWELQRKKGTCASVKTTHK